MRPSRARARAGNDSARAKALGPILPRIRQAAGSVAELAKVERRRPGLAGLALTDVCFPMFQTGKLTNDLGKSWRRFGAQLRKADELECYLAGTQRGRKFEGG